MSSLPFSLSPLPSPFPCCACHAGYLLVALPAQPRSQSSSVISDVTSPLQFVASMQVSAGENGIAVLSVMRFNMCANWSTTRLLPVDMKDEYLIPGSGLESVAKIEYF